jgi:hypothetical protein
MTHTARFYVSMLIWLHVIVVVLHGIAHGGAGVPLTSLSPKVLVVLAIGLGIGIAPLVALSLLYLRWFQWGALLLCLSMLGSLLFGVWNHFLLPGPDNIASLSAGIWQFPFRATAFLLALIEATGTITGAWLLFSTKRAQATHLS